MNVNDSDIAAARKADYPNVLNVVCSDDRGNLTIDDTWGQPEWRRWWERFHAAGGTQHAGERWPDVPPVKVVLLTEHEKLATLLAVKGVITTDEAAAVTKRAKADLVAEAEAWAVASLEVAPVKP